MPGRGPGLRAGTLAVMTPDDARWMKLAISLAWKAPPSAHAYSVGAVIVGADGQELSRGFSREGGDPHAHAEESALGKLACDGGKSAALLSRATLYSTLEPCSRRKSRPCSCTQLILATRSAVDTERAGDDAGIRRVVVAWREPSLFVADCQGIELLERAGVEVTELGELTGLAKAPNRHLGV
jgi:diaminohydroxyphosphoribosylaminopyrimidine deaminase/5-amino-6-(5-phosphoribosylamino)uracil reductase